jgi:hypothetical protein
MNILDDDDDNFVQRIEVKRNNKKATKRTQQVSYQLIVYYHILQTSDKSTKKTRTSYEDVDFDVSPAVEEKTKNCICLPYAKVYNRYLIICFDISDAFESITVRELTNKSHKLFENLNDYLMLVISG